ncbi:MAG: hypothetical protein H7844_14470 [Nitrospirae bacterium YQR-1]
MTQDDENYHCVPAPTKGLDYRSWAAMRDGAPLSGESPLAEVIPFTSLP